MSLNYLSLANVEALKVILETYDLPRYYDQHAEKVSKRLLGGLKQIGHQHVDRLHRGRTLGRLLDVQALIDKSSESATAVPQTLLASARIAEWGTPYWLESPQRRIQISPGRVTNMGWVDLKLRR